MSLAALAFVLGAPSPAARTSREQRRSLREADFYRPHDLAG